MDTLRGHFGTPDYGEDDREYDSGDEDTGLEPPVSPVGQDERRMQVRAYNHWASLLGDKSFPAIEDLDPANLTDFGPYSVLLDFSVGIDDPAVPFLGARLARECGTDGAIDRLSDVPSRSLLSRITDHYLQILANQAPIGFEAEFVNQRGSTILYRGILLPYSSDNDVIDFVYGVINWKEMPDQLSSDELLLEIDQALESDGEEAMEAAAEDEAVSPAPARAELAMDEAIEETGTTAADDLPYGTGLPRPSFGSLAQIGDDEEDYYDSDEGEEEEDLSGEAYYASLLSKIAVSEEDSESGACEEEEERDASDRKAAPADDHVRGEAANALAPLRPTKMPLDLSALSPEPLGESDEFDGAAAESARPAEPEQGFAEPVEEEFVDPEIAFAAPAGEAVPGGESNFKAPADECFGESQMDETVAPAAEDEDNLFDTLAAARELAQAARSSEDRSRVALYEAVSRAYDVSIVASENPEQFDELVSENGLTVQDRAPMTPVVKLVFGADYDKTRLTEYAAVLGHAHRLGIERGGLTKFLAQAEGGLKGVVQAERRLRREDSGKPVDPADAPREKLAEQLRQLETRPLTALEAEGAEFALVMIRRLETGEIVMLGEIAEDIPLIERAGRRLIA